MFWFAGKLGRRRVCALVKGEVDAFQVATVQGKLQFRIGQENIRHADADRRLGSGCLMQFGKDGASEAGDYNDNALPTSAGFSIGTGSTDVSPLALSAVAAFFRNHAASARWYASSGAATATSV